MREKYREDEREGGGKQLSCAQDSALNSKFCCTEHEHTHTHTHNKRINRMKIRQAGVDTHKKKTHTKLLHRYHTLSSTLLPCGNFSVPHQTPVIKCELLYVSVSSFFLFFFSLCVSYSGCKYHKALWTKKNKTIRKRTLYVPLRLLNYISLFLLLMLSACTIFGMFRFYEHNLNATQRKENVYTRLTMNMFIPRTARERKKSHTHHREPIEKC